MMHGALKLWETDRGQCSSLVVHWLLVLGNHGSNLSVGEKIFLFRFWFVISWLLFTLELIHDYAMWSIHELIHHVWLSIRLKNLKARHKTNWTKNNQDCKNGKGLNSRYTDTINIWTPYFYKSNFGMVKNVWITKVQFLDPQSQMIWDYEYCTICLVFTCQSN